MFDAHSVKESGEKAILVLWIILWIPIFARVFGLRIFQAMMPLRKEIGILMGTLAFVHSARYIVSSPDYILEWSFWIQDGFLSYLAFGFFALILTIPLTLTSNIWMMKNMGKYWKYLHRSVYVIIIFTVVHVILLKLYREFDYGLLAFLIAYFVFKILEWKGITFAWKKEIKTYPKWQKWLCVPCGFIYDPTLGDEDSGIIAGTEFVDIPDNWSCPLCGVKKWDFVPCIEWETISVWYDAKIVEKTFLNPTTLELVIETLEHLQSKAGQFVTFLWQDVEWEFSRSYSIVEQVGNRLTFTIKLSDMGRGAHLLRDITVGTSIRIRGIFGHFLLQESTYRKVFIATGTGLAPVYHMIRSLGPDIQKSLYFTVATKDELFYVDKLKTISNLDLHIHVSREEVEWYAHGRVDVDTIEAAPETEWYLCGNPKMVFEAKEKLTKKWYEKVYTEEF